ncbi:MAG: GNAT family N-acetyltransferase [Xanthomonadales bacterium]|nr:GNAT family N-acetyltransferase [Xanthomonadales bacterium]
MPIRVERYRPALAADWAQVLRHAKNGVFLFERAFMEYHGDRFRDASLLAYEDDRAVALLPAAWVGVDAVSSHPGLTFGGLVLDRQLRGSQALAILAAMLAAWRDAGARSCTIKALPSLFATYPAAEMEYALWRAGFRLARRDLSSVLPLADRLPFNAAKLAGARKARKAGVLVAPVAVTDFHAVLSSVLRERHGTDPVHSSAELALLESRFPDRILCRGARVDGRIVAGALVFAYRHVWHTQYLASTAEGRDAGALDLVVQALVEEACAQGASHLSFGTSTADAGRTVNEGLLWQKESFGARAVVHDFYEGAL